MTIGDPASFSNALGKFTTLLYAAGGVLQVFDTALYALQVLGSDQEDGFKAFRLDGVPGYACVRLTAIHSGRSWSHPNDFEPAEWYVNANDESATLQAIQKMISLNDREALQLAFSPAYTRLHHNHDFLALLSRAGLTLPASSPA